MGLWFCTVSARPETTTRFYRLAHCVPVSPTGAAYLMMRGLTRTAKLWTNMRLWMVTTCHQNVFRITRKMDTFPDFWLLLLGGGGGGGGDGGDGS